MSTESAERELAVAICSHNNLATRDAANMAPDASDERLELGALGIMDALSEVRAAYAESEAWSRTADARDPSRNTNEGE